MIHEDPHPLAGQTVTIRVNPDAPLRDLNGPHDGDLQFKVEDWWDRVSGKSWREGDWPVAAQAYLSRIRTSRDLPLDDEVVYGKVGPYGHLVHVSEISES